MKLRIALGVAALCVLGASCSTGTTPAGRASPANNADAASASSTTQAATGRNISADRTLAEQASLKLSDFPQGWTAQPSANSSSAPGIDQQMAGCLHTSVAFLQGSSPSEVQSPSFTDPGGNQAASDVDYEPSAATLAPQFAILDKPQLPSCLQSALNSYFSYALQHPSSPADSVPPGVSFGQSSVAAVSEPSRGDQSIAYQVTIPVSDYSFQIDFYADLIAIRKGRAVALLTFFGIGTPFDNTMEQQLADLTVSRMAHT